MGNIKNLIAQIENPNRADRVIECAPEIAQIAVESDNYSLYAKLVKIAGEVLHPGNPEDPVTQFLDRYHAEQKKPESTTQTRTMQRPTLSPGIHRTEAAKRLGISEAKLALYVESKYGDRKPEYLDQADIYALTRRVSRR